MKFDGVMQMIGNTPHVALRSPEAPSAHIYAKLEGYNPTGSIKDRPCLYMIRASLKDGSLRPGMTLLDASSGNMACAIAFFSRLMGYQSLVVASSKLTPDKRKFIDYFGAELLLVGDYTIEGNRYCRDRVEREKSDRFCFLDQLH